MQIKCRRAFAPKAMLLVESRPASVLDARICWLGPATALCHSERSDHKGAKHGI